MSLRNYQYNKILREYDTKQFKAKHELDERKKALYEEIPQLKEIDDEMVSKSVESAKLAIFGDESALNRIKEENLDLTMKKTELLVEHGYPADYLKPHYECEDCKDTGFIGKEKCHCFKQAIVDLVYSQSNIKAVLQEENFKAFRLGYYSDTEVDSATGLTPQANIRRVLSTVNSFMENFETSYSNLFLYGNAGTGKTFLSNCIAKELLDRGHTIIYLTSFQLFNILEKQAFSRDEEGKEADNQLEYILDCDLLIIDDLGTELSNSFTNTKLFLCINERHLRSKSTIISSNLPLESIKANYSERIYSRITADYICLKLFGNDIRLQKRFS